MAIVTTQQAIDHLKLPIVVGASDPQEADVVAKLAAADAIVLDYIKAAPDAVWTDAQLAILSAAILLQFGELWRYRGDDPDTDAAPTTAGDLSPTITNLLRRMRTPAIA
jgi:hypothetical protein